MDEIKRSHSPIVQTNFFEGAKLENGLIKLNGDIYEISYVGMKQGSKIPPKELEKIGNFVLALLKNIKMEASPDALKLTKDRITHLKTQLATYILSAVLKNK